MNNGWFFVWVNVDIYWVLIDIVVWIWIGNVVEIFFGFFGCDLLLFGMFGWGGRIWLVYGWNGNLLRILKFFFLDKLVWMELFILGVLVLMVVLIVVLFFKLYFGWKLFFKILLIDFIKFCLFMYWVGDDNFMC